MKTSVIVPVYNEINGVTQVIEELKQLKRNGEIHEIIAVDDGSCDGTTEVLMEIQDIRFIRHYQNLGYGSAIKSGIKVSTGDIIVITDADCTYPNSMIPALIESIHKGAAMAIGARTSPQATIPLIRRPAKYALRLWAQYISGQKIPDLNSGLRAMRRDLLASYIDILPDGFSFTTTITLAALCDHIPVEYIPVSYNPRRGKSKIAPIADTSRFIQLILRTALYFRPLRIFIPLSFLIATTGMIVLLVSAWLGQVMDITSTVLLLTSIQIGAIGMLADLVVRRSADKKPDTHAHIKSSIFDSTATAPKPGANVPHNPASTATTPRPSANVPHNPASTATTPRPSANVPHNSASTATTPAPDSDLTRTRHDSNTPAPSPNINATAPAPSDNSAGAEP